MDEMNNLGHELMAQDAMNNSMLWMIRTNQGYEPKTVDDMNDFGSWPQDSRHYELLRVMDDMYNSQS